MSGYDREVRRAEAKVRAYNELRSKGVMVDGVEVWPHWYGGMWVEGKWYGDMLVYDNRVSELSIRLGSTSVKPVEYLATDLVKRGLVPFGDVWSMVEYNRERHKSDKQSGAAHSKDTPRSSLTESQLRRIDRYSQYAADYEQLERSRNRRVLIGFLIALLLLFCLPFLTLLK